MSQRGSIRRRGNSWTAYWRIDTSTGEKQHTKGGFATRKDAQTYLNEQLNSVRVGEFAEPNKLTVGDYLVERWMPTRAINVRPSTLNMYEVNIRRHVIPAIGPVRLQLLAPDQLDRLYASLTASGLSPKTVRNIHVMLHKALADAVRKNLAPRNVAEAADPPKLNRADRAEMQTWSPAELRAFFEGLNGHRLAAAYLLAATTGMRRGEVLGLRWQDIDFDARHLVVNQTVLSVSYEVMIGMPKTTRSRRKIRLDNETIATLKAHRQAQLRERKLVGSGYVDNDLVFARAEGTPVHPDYFSQTFDRTVKRLDLPKIRLHDLRHTHATLGLAAGIPVKVMSDRLGHATTSFTQDVYMHVIPDLAHDAADQIAGLVFGT